MTIQLPAADICQTDFVRIGEQWHMAIVNAERHTFTAMPHTDVQFACGTHMFPIDARATVQFAYRAGDPAMCPTCAVAARGGNPLASLHN